MAAPISCIVTSYNNQSTLSAALNSVLNQTLPVAEIVVADDGSTDGSRDIIRAFSEKYDCIRPIFRSDNLGVAANRDLAIRSSQQPFVTHLDGDDRFSQRKIEREWLALGGQKNSVAYSLIASVCENKWWRTRVLDPSETVRENDKAFTCLIERKGAIPRDMLMSRDLFERAGGFNHSIPIYEDWDFKLRLAQCADQWLSSGVVGTLYFQHSHGLSSKNREFHLKWQKKICRQYQEESDFNGYYPGRHLRWKSVLNTALLTMVRFRDVRETLKMSS